ncbi:MAG: hypothetical protein ACRCWR_11590 [Saezia sp.]
MNMEVTTLCLGEPITAKAEWMGKDLCVMVTGGEEPHFGSVSLGISRKSLTGSGETSATVSTMNMTGHKDDVVGNHFAKEIATEFECRVVVACGIHFDGAGPIEIQAIEKAANELLESLKKALQKKDFA